MSLKLAGTAIGRESGNDRSNQRPDRPSPSESSLNCHRPFRLFRSRVLVSSGRSMEDPCSWLAGVLSPFNRHRTGCATVALVALCRFLIIAARRASRDALWRFRQQRRSPSQPPLALRLIRAMPARGKGPRPGSAYSARISNPYRRSRTAPPDLSNWRDGWRSQAGRY